MRWGLTANCGKKLRASWYTPPKNCECETLCTPGTDSICGNSRIGNGWVKLTRAWVIKRLAPRKSAPPENSEFTACNNPSNRNAALNDRPVNSVRVFLRHKPDQISGRYLSNMDQCAQAPASPPC